MQLNVMKEKKKKNLINIITSFAIPYHTNYPSHVGSSLVR